jgi:NAD(P)-dependent dehydrogenase (short-subunit alcohol dehydrogenase family)
MHILITGASSGIGERIAYEYAERGANIAVFARRRERLQQVADNCTRLGAASTLVLHGDTSQPADVARAAEQLHQTFPTIERAYLNAGIGGSAETFSAWTCCDDARAQPDQFDASFANHVMATNYGGIALWLQHLFAHMKTTGGVIAATGSMSADGLLTSAAPYMASKMAVRGLIRGLSPRARKLGIRMVLIEPGFVATQQTGDNSLPFLISADTAAIAIVRRVERGDSTVRIPTRMSVANRLVAALPISVYQRGMDLVERFQMMRKSLL